MPNKIMGIKLLNKFLLKQCKDEIKCVKLSSLSDKCIAIDTSIFMYKYESEGNLIENMNKLIKVLLNNKIIPIFVLDGKIMENKKEIISIRKELKKISKTKKLKLPTLLLWKLLSTQKKISYRRLEISLEVSFIKNDTLSCNFINDIIEVL
jgi:hypothetical protein